MFVYLDSELSWPEIVKSTVKDAMQDDILGIAAQLAFYFFLSLFPALLFLVALASFFPLINFTDDLMRILGPIAPQAVLELLRDQLVKLSDGNDVGLLSFGLLMAVWSSSAALVSIIDAMNKAYDIEDSRPWWKARLTAIVLTIGLALFILTSFTLVIAGPEIADFLGGRLGMGPMLVWGWKILQWPVVFLLVSWGFAIVYYYAPDAEQEWAWITPGALMATLLWLIASLAFRFYVVHFGNFEEAYGTLGAIILTLLWFYITGLVMVVGAELSAEIEHASPWGKEPGEKVPGERKRIGLAASREWLKKHPSASHA